MWRVSGGGDFFFREDARGAHDTWRTAHYTQAELTFADDTTTIGWDVELDTLEVMAKARLFGSHVERVSDEKEAEIKSGERIMVRRWERATPTFLDADWPKTAEETMARWRGFRKE